MALSLESRRFPPSWTLVRHEILCDELAEWLNERISKL